MVVFSAKAGVADISPKRKVAAIDERMNLAFIFKSRVFLANKFRQEVMTSYRCNLVFNKCVDGIVLFPTRCVCIV
ncbi:hypothetical protein VoSk93_45800 [Vibrio owensii]